VRLRSLIVVALCSCGLFGDLGRGDARAQAAAPVDRATSSGLGFGVGVGSENVTIGGHVLYYLQLKEPRMRVAFHVGAGYLPNVAEDVPLWGITGGSFFGYGKRNRLVVGLIGGTLDWLSFSPHGETLAARQLFGLGLSAGWELMTRRGFFVRGSVGPALTIVPEVPLAAREANAWFVFSTSIGYKPW
jgi:hypothetical protein